jgi:hypothetical protein
MPVDWALDRRGFSCLWCATNSEACFSIQSTSPSTRCPSACWSDEPCDSPDILFVHNEVLRLAGFPGRQPGRIRVFPARPAGPSRAARPAPARGFCTLRLAAPFDLAQGKDVWLAALAEADRLARLRSSIARTGCHPPAMNARPFPARRCGPAKSSEGSRRTARARCAASGKTATSPSMRATRPSVSIALRRAIACRNDET